MIIDRKGFPHISASFRIHYIAYHVFLARIMSQKMSLLWLIRPKVQIIKLYLCDYDSDGIIP